MIIARPTVTEERWLHVAARYPALRAAAEQTGEGGNWKTTTWLGRCLGVLLCLFGMSMLGGVLSQFPAPLLTGGLLLVVVAEWLVARRRVFRSGIEEVLYLCGAVAVVGQMLIWSHGNNVGLAIALVATAVLLAGWRLLNPLFATLAAMGYSFAIALFDERLLDGHVHMLEAGVASAVLAVVALVAAGRKWQRPSRDAMFDGLVIVMPLLAYGWLVAYRWSGASMNWAALALALAFVTTWLIVGVKRRQHAPLIGALGLLVCVAYSLHELLHWSMHWELIAAGGALLVVSVTLDRRLRHRADGITCAKIDEPALDLLQVAGAAHLTPAPVAAPPAGVQGQGGEFGGGGASGRF
jgi:hypothetical protein